MLVLGDRTRFLELDYVTQFAKALRVVNLELVGNRVVLTVLGVRHATIHSDHSRLLHCRGNDNALEAAGFSFRFGGRLCVSGCHTLGVGNLGLWFGSDGGEESCEVALLVAHLADFSVLAGCDLEPKFTDRALQVGGLACELGGGLLLKFFRHISC